MIYADTSALAKLLVDEPQSEALGAWLDARPDQALTTNTIGVVELHRFAGRIGPEIDRAATRFLASVDTVPLTPAAVALAGRLSPPAVRTLDALHIASAAELPDLTYLVSYDHRMLEAAADYGLPVASPV
ncbi:MAG: type II toxin-antitoxin system VapC family toxin [Marmoricola sp.]